MSPIYVPGKVVLAQISQPLDADAQAYVNAVEVADGQRIEDPVRFAINNFVIGCKADGIWSEIKASCILAGARTLNGALVPLAGTAPTNFNFVSGDYDRKTGLIGNGTTKYLNSNRANNADPQNSKHIALYVSVLPDFTAINGLAGFASPLTGSTGLIGYSNLFEVRLNGSNASTVAAPASPCMLGASRVNSSQVVIRSGQASTTVSNTSQSPATIDIDIFRRRADFYSNSARLAFYSIGESLDLALLDARVTDLINAFAAAIP
jgi:hypothetical protein